MRDSNVFVAIKNGELLETVDVEIVQFNVDHYSRPGYLVTVGADVIEIHSMDNESTLVFERL